MTIEQLTPQQLRRAADIQEKILALQDEFKLLAGTPPTDGHAQAPSGKRRLSAQGIANIRAGVRKRQAKAQRAAVAAEPAPQPKRYVSPAARARLSAMAKARWRRAKAAGRARL